MDQLIWVYLSIAALETWKDPNFHMEESEERSYVCKCHRWSIRGNYAEARAQCVNMGISRDTLPRLFESAGEGEAGFCHSTAEERVTLMPAELARPAPPPWRGRGRSRSGHAGARTGDRCGPRSPPCDRRGPCSGPARQGTALSADGAVEAVRGWRGGPGEP